MPVRGVRALWWRQPVYPAGAYPPAALLAAARLSGVPDAVVDAVAAALVTSVHVRDGVTSDDARALLLAAGFRVATTVIALRRRLPVRLCRWPPGVQCS